MAATIPNKIVKFKELEKDFGTTISTALWKKAGQLMNYANASVPIGKLMFVREVQPGAVTPDAKYWKLMDGTAVTNVESPLYGLVLPAMTNKFIKHPSTSESQYVTGGSTSVDVRHGHNISSVSDLGVHNADDSDEAYTGSYHTHLSLLQLDTFDPTPQYHSYKIYMRIV